jgi:hypothetical protein
MCRTQQVDVSQYVTTHLNYNALVANQCLYADLLVPVQSGAAEI